MNQEDIYSGNDQELYEINLKAESLKELLTSITEATKNNSITANDKFGEQVLSEIISKLHSSLLYYQEILSRCNYKKEGPTLK